MEGVFFSLRKGILCVQEMGRDDRYRGSRGTALRNTNGCRLWSRSGSRLGAHTNLNGARRGCICPMAVIVIIEDRVSMVISGVSRANAKARGSRAKIVASVWKEGARGAENPYVPTSVRLTTPLN